MGGRGLTSARSKGPKAYRDRLDQRGIPEILARREKLDPRGPEVKRVLSALKDRKVRPD